MSTIIKEPFAPRRRHLNNHGQELRLLCRRLYQSVVGARKLAEASREDRCMAVLVVSLLMVTLLLPWVL
jgi:hypothetical protein